MHLFPCARGPPLVRSKANWWIGSQEPSVNAESPLLTRSDLFDSFCTLGTWFDLLHLSQIPVELTLAAHCHVWNLHILCVPFVQGFALQPGFWRNLPHSAVEKLASTGCSANCFAKVVLWKSLPSVAVLEAFFHFTQGTSCASILKKYWQISFINGLNT